MPIDTAPPPAVRPPRPPVQIPPGRNTIKPFRRPPGGGTPIRPGKPGKPPAGTPKRVPTGMPPSTLSFMDPTLACELGFIECDAPEPPSEEWQPGQSPVDYRVWIAGESHLYDGWHFFESGPGVFRGPIRGIFTSDGEPVGKRWFLNHADQSSIWLADSSQNLQGYRNVEVSRLERVDGQPEYPPASPRRNRPPEPEPPSGSTITAPPPEIEIPDTFTPDKEQEPIIPPGETEIVPFKRPKPPEQPTPPPPLPGIPEKPRTPEEPPSEPEQPDPPPKYDPQPPTEPQPPPNEDPNRTPEPDKPTLPGPPAPHKPGFNPDFDPGKINTPDRFDEIPFNPPELDPPQFPEFDPPPGEQEEIELEPPPGERTNPQPPPGERQTPQPPTLPGFDRGRQGERERDRQRDRDRRRDTAPPAFDFPGTGLPGGQKEAERERQRQQERDRQRDRDRDTDTEVDTPNQPPPFNPPGFPTFNPNPPPGPSQIKAPGGQQQTQPPPPPQQPLPPPATPPYAPPEPPPQDPCDLPLQPDEERIVIKWVSVQVPKVNAVNLAGQWTSTRTIQTVRVISTEGGSEVDKTRAEFEMRAITAEQAIAARNNSGNNNVLNIAIQARLETLNLFLRKAWETTRMQKVLDVLTFVAVMHNVALLSRDVGETFGWVASQALQIVGIKDEEDNPIDVYSWFTGSIESLLTTVLGEEVVNGVQETWNKASAIIRSASMVIWTIRGIMDSSLDLMEWISEHTGKIGNALKAYGVVGKRAYPWMSERAEARNRIRTRFNKVTGALENAEDVGSSFGVATGSVLEVQDEVGELGDNFANFRDSVIEGVPDPWADNNPVKDAQDDAAAASISADIAPTDTARSN